MDVQQLAGKENELLYAVMNMAGSIEEKSQGLAAIGVFNSYNEIHFQYAELAEDSIKALKRGLFLQWYRSVEPSFLTGIDNIIFLSEQKILEVLDQKIIEEKVNTELTAMLSYYAGWEFAFSRFQNYKNLKAYLQDKLSYNDIIRQIDSSNLCNRGQMGIYWQSIILFEQQ